MRRCPFGCRPFLESMKNVRGNEHAARAVGVLVWVTFSTIASAVELEDLVAPGARVERIAQGFQFVEGPAWSPDGFLLFSDIPASRIIQLNPDGSLENFLRPSGQSNGLMFDRAGFLYICQHGPRQVARIDPENDKELTVLAGHYDGGRLNSPNDLALDAHGGIYFTDPRYGGGTLEQPVMGVYHIDSEGEVSRIIDDLRRPNGILVSPDGLHLYVAEPDRRQLYRYRILAPGEIDDKTLIFTGDAGTDGSGPDGMAHDVHGNIYATYRSVVVLDPDGNLIGRIGVSQPPANCAFGGQDNRTLYITARTSLYKIDMQVEGMALAESHVIPAAPFVRGDFNDDASVNIGDPIAILDYLFTAREEPRCLDAGDSNDDGCVDITDPVYLLNFLFAGTVSPRAPFPDCGEDPTSDRLACVRTACGESDG